MSAPVGPKPMKAYMAWDDVAGSHEGAALVFAPNRREARRLAWRVVWGWFMGEFTDLRVRVLPGDASHMRLSDGPHVVESPPVCEQCNVWTTEPLNDRGICEACNEDGEDA